MKELLLSNKIMLFKHLRTGDIIETRNMCYALYESLYEFMGYKN